MYTSRPPACSEESRTARISTSVLPEGIHTTIRKEGEKNLLFTLAILIIPRNICSAALKSAITPSRNGRIVLILSWVLPCICLAFSPMAITFSVFRSMATMEGSLTTILSLQIIMVFAVPKSTAISCVKNENNPILIIYYYNLA